MPITDLFPHLYEPEEVNPPPFLPLPVPDVPLGQVSPTLAEEVLRQLGLSTIPTQTARLNEAINQLVPQIQGSPAEIRSSVMPQIEQIRGNLKTAFDTVSQRLGRFGGGQVQREKGKALGQAGQQLQNVFANQPVVATQQLLQLLQGFSPILIAQPPLQTTSQSLPFEFSSLGQDVVNIGNTIRSLLQDGGVSPFSNTIGSGINPWTGSLITSNTGMLGGGV